MQLELDCLRWLSATESLCKRLVDSYALPLAIIHDSYEHRHIFNDFVYFCFTKSTKTLAAINRILADGFGEDAQILLRSSYESYLAIAFLTNHPSRLDDLVAKKVGLKTGDFSHPVSPTGRKDYRRVVDTQSGEILPFSLSVAEMAGLTKYPEDLFIHRALYAFLSEHCHAHMMASGNYRDDKNERYVYENRSQVLQATVFGAYVYAVTLSELAGLQRMIKAHRTRASRVVSNGRDLLLRAFDLLEFENDLAELPKWLRARLRHFEPTASEA